MGVDAERAEEETAAPAQGRYEAGLPRSDVLQPAAPDCGGHAKQHEKQREHPAHAGDLPVAGGGEEFLHQRHVGACFRRTQPERARQRQPEHAEAIGHAYAQMNAKRRRRNQPAIEAGGRNRPLFVKESRSCTGDAPGAADCCHRYFPLQPTVELGVFTVFDPVFSHAVEQPHPAVPCNSRMCGDRHAHSRTPTTLMLFDYARSNADQLR